MSNGKFFPSQADAYTAMYDINCVAPKKSAYNTVLLVHKYAGTITAKTYTYIHAHTVHCHHCTQKNTTHNVLQHTTHARTCSISIQSQVSSSGSGSSDAATVGQYAGGAGGGVDRGGTCGV